MKKTTVYLPDDLLREVESLARREGRPQAQIVREALTKYVTDNPRPMPSIIGIAQGPEDGVDSTNVKAWLKENWIKDLDRKYGDRLTPRDADD